MNLPRLRSRLHANAGRQEFGEIALISYMTDFDERLLARQSSRFSVFSQIDSGI